ncbi:hypothetical protein K2173_023613 [Erythroxylum novogranatense]|uniref:HMA domain-containing protein n=1 Tax=Erythroxylum novogranatense TaxID=1862640 RepID=A0AAV8TRK5_9ROSI|nr:hypothetical protein K2173_023613 [Erythroxylum novogranatense]
MYIFCAPTAVCSRTDHKSMVRKATRPVDRPTSIRCTPCSSHELPIDPRILYEKIRKSSSAKQSAYLHRKSFAAGTSDGNNLTKQSELHRKSDAHGPSRYLLRDEDAPFIDWISDSDQISALVPGHHAKPRHRSPSYYQSPALRSSSSARSRDWSYESGYVSELIPDKGSKFKPGISNESPAFASSSSARSHEQVVVLKVSIHCKGCEGKVRKHISKMEGVTSFSVDLDTKKVIVIGDVTPSGVLESVSKAKSAQLWPSSPT